MKMHMKMGTIKTQTMTGFCLKVFLRVIIIQLYDPCGKRHHLTGLLCCLYPLSYFSEYKEIFYIKSIQYHNYNMTKGFERLRIQLSIKQNIDLQIFILRLEIYYSHL